jgi:hypothetical protein
MRRLLIALVLSSAVSACRSPAPSETASVSSTTTTAPATTVSPFASASVELWDYCAEASSVGGLVRKVRKGTELPESLVAEAEELHDHLVTFAGTVSDPKGQSSLRDLTSAVGTLEVALSGAGSTYAFNTTVQLRAKTVSYSALTASILTCS